MVYYVFSQKAVAPLNILNLNSEKKNQKKNIANTKHLVSATELTVNIWAPAI